MMPRSHQVLNKTRLYVSFVFLVFLLFVSRPNVTLYLTGFLIFTCGALLRIWASGYIVKVQELARDGPYIWCRHPLYFGNALEGAGFCLMSGQWRSLPVFLIVTGLLYIPLIIMEEKFLLKIFCEDYRAYQKQVPCFFPYPKGLTSLEKFNVHLVIRNREHFQSGILLLLAALLGYKNL